MASHYSGIVSEVLDCHSYIYQDADNNIMACYDLSNLLHLLTFCTLSFLWWMGGFSSTGNISVFYDTQQGVYTVEFYFKD